MSSTHSTQKEIQTYIQVSVDDQILVFDITVSDPLRVEIMHGFDDLREDVSCLVLGETLMLALLNALKEIVRWTARKVGTWFRGNKTLP